MALIRADFPLDAFNHVRHLPNGPCATNSDLPVFGGCAVEDIATGDWEAICGAIRQENITAPPLPPGDACVPRWRPYPDTVGYE